MPAISLPLLLGVVGVGMVDFTNSWGSGPETVALQPAAIKMNRPAPADTKRGRVCNLFAPDGSDGFESVLLENKHN